MLKQCSACAKEGIGPKDISSFKPDKRYQNGFHSWCRDHLNAYSRKWKKRDPVRAKIGECIAGLKSNYGLSADEYTKLLKKADHKCEICSVPLVSALENARLSLGLKRQAIACVDHCHETGRVRGILCLKCNAGIGNFKESTESLRRAIQYLAQPDAGA